MASECDLVAPANAKVGTSEMLINFIFFGCVDINECPGQCEQQCKNTVGSYECKCNAGYLLANDQRSCLGILFMKTSLLPVFGLCIIPSFLLCL